MGHIAEEQILPDQFNFSCKNMLSFVDCPLCVFSSIPFSVCAPISICSFPRSALYGADPVALYLLLAYFMPVELWASGKTL